MPTPTLVQARLRTHSARERAADAMVHVVGLAAGVAGSLAIAALAAHTGRGSLLAAILIYCACMLSMLGASAAYNLAYHTAHRPLLRGLDHAAIFLMIAGTYTPFTTQALHGGLAIGATATVWGLALAGIALKLGHAPLFDRLAVALYLALGWVALVFVQPLVVALPASALLLLVVGGLLYTIGVLFHVWERLPYQNAIWHGFVLAAAACQYGAVIVGVVVA